jgi:hypothetical protein
MCSQYHHTFMAYVLPKVVLFSSILGGPNRNFQTLQSFNANQNGSLWKEKLKFLRHPHLIELNHAYTTHRIAQVLVGIKFIFCVVRGIYQRFKV